jgi:hypothetical protein
MTGISVAAKSHCRKPVQPVRRYLHTTPTGLLAVEMFKECARQATPPILRPKVLARLLPHRVAPRLTPCGLHQASTLPTLTTLGRALSLPAGSRRTIWAHRSSSAHFWQCKCWGRPLKCRSAPSTFCTMAATLPLCGCRSPDLWIVDRFSGDGGCRGCALARRRWHPRAAITVQ